LNQTATGRRFLGVIELAPNVYSSHAWTLLFGALTTIGLLTFVGIGTPYVLTEHLKIPISEQGEISGWLVVVTEITQLLLFNAVGVWSDRAGRRPVYVLGMLFMGLGYFLYPLAGSIPELTAYRVIYAAGIAAATGMLGTVANDYPAERSRGKMIAAVGIMNGLGVIIIAVVMGGMPEALMDRGFDGDTAGRYTHWMITAICVVSAAVLATGLKGGTPVAAEERASIAELVRSGFARARNSRIALAYASAFVARSDLVILGTFTVLWGSTAGIAAGMDSGEAVSAGRRIFVVCQTAALLWAFVIGIFLDRFNRVTGLLVCMGLAAAGYLGMGLVEDPLDSAAVPLFALLGVGQISAFFGATALIGQEAPLVERGSVIGMFNLSGAIGIMVSAFFGGMLFDRVAPNAPFVMIGVLNLVVVAFAVVVRWRSPGSMPG
jgi:MFS family permease